MGLRKVHIMGDKLKGLTLSGTQYSNKFGVGRAPTWSAQFAWTGTPTVNITLWVSNLDDPIQTSDTDWVQLTAVHGYGGLPKGNPSGSASKDFVGINGAGGAWYRFRTILTNGSGTMKIIAHSKDTE